MKMICKTCGKKNCGTLIDDECDGCYVEQPPTLLGEIDWLRRQEKDVEKEIAQLEKHLVAKMERKITPMDRLMELYGQRMILSDTLGSLAEIVGVDR